MIIKYNNSLLYIHNNHDHIIKICSSINFNIFSFFYINNIREYINIHYYYKEYWIIITCDLKDFYIRKAFYYSNMKYKMPLNSKYKKFKQKIMYHIKNHDYQI